MFKLFCSLTIIFCCHVLPLSAQSGCTDPKALNYNASATVNDGSCQYAVINYSPVLQAPLPDKLKEISGLAYAGNRWWAHEDSGANEIFYQINPLGGQIIQQVALNNAKNNDWEDIAQDSAYLYIGDFGNNSSTRKNLGIYRVPLSKIGNGSSEKIEESDWSFLPFAYPDQTIFSQQPEDSTEFDCEAMIYKNGALHLFTKNRKKYQTSHYRIDVSTGSIKKIETFDTGGLITGASVSPDEKMVALVGYNLRSFPTVFAWLLWDWPNPSSDSLFSGNKRRIELGTALAVGQVESIAFGGSRDGYIANESTSFNGIVLAPQALRHFDFGAWVSAMSANEETHFNAQSGKIFPNPFSQFIDFQWEESKPPEEIRLRDAQGRLLKVCAGSVTRMDTQHLPCGIYMVEAIWPKRTKTYCVQKS